MRANTPVAGTFERKTVFNPEWLKEFKEMAERNFKRMARPGVTMGKMNEEPFVRCNWAWNNDRHYMEALPGSNDLQSFYEGNRALIERMDKHACNYYARQRSSYYSPASFYFLGMTRMTWEDIFSTGKVSLSPLPPQAPPGTALLVVKFEQHPDFPRECRMLIQKDKAILRGFETYCNGKLELQLKIHEFTHADDHRLFPKSAQLTLWQSRTGRKIFDNHLTAQEIRFPKNEQETVDAFHMILPAGSHITDHALQRQINLKVDTTAEWILGGGIPFQPIRD